MNAPASISQRLDATGGEVDETRGEIGPFPAMARYLERIRARPAYGRARERARESEARPRSG